MVNNKVYIGQTNNIKRRLLQHKNKARNNNTKPLYVDIQKFGWDVFDFEILYETDSHDKLNEKERYYIKKFNAIKMGYNVQEGGNAMHNPVVIAKHRQSMSDCSTRKRISDSLKSYRKNNDFTQEHRDNLSRAMLGNHNFGDSDTRSIGCFCIDNLGEKHEFHNIESAGIWWHNTYNPFNCEYNYATYRRKIQDCINSGCCYFGRGKNRVKIDNIQWYLNP